MLAEALSSFGLILIQQLQQHLAQVRNPAAPPAANGLAANGLATDDVDPAPHSQRVPLSWWGGGLALSIASSVLFISPMFDMPHASTLLATLMSCLIAVLAVRALGQTDLNPVSAVGKLSQIVFAFVAPGHVVANIVAGAIAEAGAMQAGELLQDLKAGHLLGASPRAQFFGQLAGATVSCFATVGAYNLYDRSYGIPSAQFQAPSAHVWKDMAVLMQQGISALPPTALVYARWFGLLGAILPLIESSGSALAPYLPSGMAFGVGMYLTPDWTVPRVIGAVVEWCWRRSSPDSHQKHMLMVASGFVLGEGVWSIGQLVLKSLHL